MKPKKDVNILIVDDDEDLREIIAINLQRRGYNVVTAGRGTEAIEIMKEKRFSIAFVDLKMPGINGVETIKRMRNIDSVVSIVVITGSSEWLDESVAPDVYCYIHKPFKLSKIREVIQQILDK